MWSLQVLWVAFLSSGTILLNFERITHSPVLTEDVGRQVEAGGLVWEPITNIQRPNDGGLNEDGSHRGNGK